MRSWIILQEPEERYESVFLKMKESGLKLNLNLYQIRKNSIVFLGHIISAEIIEIDPSKTKTITNIPPQGKLPN